MEENTQNAVETPFAAFAAYWREGLLARKRCVVAITQGRVLVAMTSQKMVDAYAKEAAGEAKQSGKGFLGRIGALIMAKAVFARRYLELRAGDILAESAENFAIDNTEVVQVKLKSGSHSTGSDDSSRYEPGGFTLETARNKYKFDFMDEGAEKEARAALPKVLKL